MKRSFNDPSYLLYILILLSIFQCWTIGSYTNPVNSTVGEKNEIEISGVRSLGNESKPLLSKFEPSKFPINRGNFTDSGTLERNTSALDAPKRTKRCLLALILAGGIATATSWVWRRPPPPQPIIVWITTTTPPTTTTKETTTQRLTTTTERATTRRLKTTTTTTTATIQMPKTKTTTTTTTIRATQKSTNATTSKKPLPEKLINFETTPKPPKKVTNTASLNQSPPPIIPETPGSIDEPVEPPKNCDTLWGSCVINGTPKYNIDNATIIQNVTLKMVKNIWILEFVHPVTYNVIQLPRNIGDEYVIVDKITKRDAVFMIFVDHRSRTYLIYKGTPGDATITTTMINITTIMSNITYIESSNNIPEPNSHKEKTIYTVTNINININMIMNFNKMLSILTEKGVGYPVINGVPKYNIENATFIMKIRKLIINGIWVIEFVHPVTGTKIQTPEDVGDEYIIEATKQIFKIFVDTQGRTYMIFKRQNDSSTITGANDKNEQKKLTIMGTNDGAASIGNVPPYNISNAVKIEQTVQKIINGILFIEFLHTKTEKIIRVAFNVGDEYHDKLTNKVYLIFVDNLGQTLLIFKGFSNKIDPRIVQKISGTVVIDGKPNYNVSNATIVTNSVQKYGIDGKPVIEFVHPLTGEMIHIPVDIGKTYVNKVTKKIYIIFVDIQGRTLLIFKGLATSEEIMSETIVGTLVINRRPKFNIDEALIVMKTVKKARLDGTIVIEFEHPITRQIAQIPINLERIADEYAEKTSGKLFIIFVDSQGRTLLIFKGWMHNKEHEDIVTDDGTGDNNVDGDVTTGGYLVIHGKPSYNLRTAIVIKETVQKIGLKGNAIIEFTHPVSKQKIQIPLNVGCQIRNKVTNEVYKIFVDLLGRTYLILRSNSTATNPSIGNNTTEEFIKSASSVKPVINGIPKYNLTSAIYVDKTEQTLGRNGTIVIVFEHPFTGRIIEISYATGDVYMKPETKKVYKITIDTEGRTLMIYMAREEHYKQEYWISIVKNDYPKHDISKAIIVMDSQIRIKRNGINVMEYLEFRHPFSNVLMRVSTNDAKVYVKPGTRQMFIVCVDNRDRTLLIFKHLSKVLPNSDQGYENKLNINNNDNIHVRIHDDEKDYGLKTKNKVTDEWGSRVVDGDPSYNLSTAINITKTTKKILPNGDKIIEFTHPDTDEIISVPYDGGDEFIDKDTKRIFIICVDRRQKTLLIFKAYRDKVTHHTTPPSPPPNFSRPSRPPPPPPPDKLASSESESDVSEDRSNSFENNNINVNTNINRNVAM